MLVLCKIYVMTETLILFLIRWFCIQWPHFTCVPVMELKVTFQVWHQLEEAYDGSWRFRLGCFHSWVVTCIFICIFYINSFRMCLARWKLRSSYAKWCLFSFSLFELHSLTYLMFRWIWMVPIFLKLSWYIY